MDVLPTLLGALPQLGALGVGLALLTVFRIQQKSDTADLRKEKNDDRDYFQRERERIRAEAAEDITRVRDTAAEARKELVADLAAAKQELREQDRLIDELRARLHGPATAMYRQGSTTQPLPGRHRPDNGPPDGAPSPP